MPQYTADHGWLKVTVAAVGLASHPVGRLVCFVFAQPPATRAPSARRHTAMTTGSVKAASNVCCLPGRKGVETDEAVASDRSIANADANGAGWLSKVKLARAADADAPRDEAAYLALAG